MYITREGHLKKGNDPILLLSGNRSKKPEGLR